MPGILDYTLAQVRSFLAAIDLQRRATLKDHALATRAAASESKDFKRYLRSIDGNG